MFTSGLFFGTPSSGAFRRYAMAILSFLIIFIYVATLDRESPPGVLWAFTVLLALVMLPISLVSAYRINKYVKIARANHPNYDFSKLSNKEIIYRTKLQNKFPSFNLLDLTELEIKELKQKRNQENIDSLIDTVKAVKGAGDQFMTGFTGTEKKIRCINCGCRLRLGLLGKWEPISSAASSCSKQNKNCVGVEDPTP